MRRLSLLALALSVSAFAAANQNPSFRHILRLDISDKFTANTNLGSLASDVAFDGTNLYVSGAREASGVGSVGVLKVANLFSSATQSTFFNVNAAGGGRDSKLGYFNNKLHFGYGLGQTSNTDSGIVRLDSAGVAEGGFSGGVLTPDEIGGTTSQRTEAFAADPRGGIAYLNRGRGILFRTDLSGANSGNIALSGQPTTAWRDVAFDADGNAFFRLDNDVYRADRTGTTGLSSISRIVDLSAVDLALMNVHVGAGTADYFSFLTYNSRVTGANAVQVAGLNGASIGTLTGAEAIGGVAQTAFSTNLLNFTTAFVGEQQYLFVVQGGASDLISVYEVVPEPGTMAALALGLGAIAARRRRKA